MTKMLFIMLLVHILSIDRSVNMVTLVGLLIKVYRPN